MSNKLLKKIVMLKYALSNFPLCTAKLSSLERSVTNQSDKNFWPRFTN